MQLDFFAEKELACPTTGEIELEDGFGDYLVALRLDFNEPMTLTSACRTLKHNEKVGGHERSLHLIDNPYWGTDTIAVDVSCSNSVYRSRLIRQAQFHGWSVGVASNFLHLDMRTKYIDMPQAIYHYKR